VNVASRSICSAVLSAIGIAWLCAVPASVSSAPTPSWVSFQSSDAGFSVEMPTNPVPSTLVTRSFIGDVTSHLFTSWEGNAKFTVDYSKIPDFALRFAGADTIYDHARGALLKQTWSKPVSFVDVTVNGKAGKQLVYDTPPVPGKPELAGVASFFLVGDRLYVADATVPAGASEADAQRFLASLRFE
jgi:hypothetical protein